MSRQSSAHSSVAATSALFTLTAHVSNTAHTVGVVVATRTIPPGEHVPTADQRIVLWNASWQRYEVELALRGESPLPRLHYLDGTLELMRPSQDHERLSQFLARLVEVFAEEHDIALAPYGSWTLKSGAGEAGAEPDQCYIIGTDQSKSCPDLAIEVVWTSGGIDKLEIYKRLGITEVWFWLAGTLAVHRLGANGYEQVATSAFFPGLDLDLLCSFLDRATLNEAKHDYRAALHTRA